MGGKGKPFNTKCRDLGCPTVLIAYLWFLLGFHWIYIAIFGLSFGALTTYWDFLFGYDNFWFHGFMCSLPTMLLAFYIPWWIPLIHIFICTVGMGLWSELIGLDWLEEGGRGVFFIL
jgi:hypothetical protein